MSPPTHLQFAKKMATSDEVMPRIVLIPHARSHPFAQRDCVLKEPLKVGRPVDKKRISQNNLIFDCRVLSRNHALIWFENGMVSPLVLVMWKSCDLFPYSFTSKIRKVVMVLLLMSVV